MVWSLQEAHAEFAALWVQGDEIEQRNATVTPCKLPATKCTLLTQILNSATTTKSEDHSMSDSITRHKTNSIEHIHTSVDTPRRPIIVHEFRS